MMVNYNYIKKYLKQSRHLNAEQFYDNINKSKFDNITKLILLLCHNHAYTFRSLIINYIPRKAQNIEQLKNMLKYKFSFLFFRYFFFFYLLINYVYRIELSKDDIRIVFDNYLRFTKKFKSSQNSQNIVQTISNIFDQNFDFLYKTFFIDHNIYFHVYFNNLIKHFLPVPYSIIKYYPIITYRNRVKHFYKKDDIDYLGKITDQDGARRLRYVQKKNIDKIYGEIDIHIPLKYFDPTKYEKHIFLIGIYDKGKYQLIICNSINFNGSQFKILRKNFMYSRYFDRYHDNQYKKGLSFEHLSEIWDDEKLEIIANIDDIVYISIMKEMDNNDIYKVFNRMEFNKDHYINLFHNTGLNINKCLISSLLNYPTFFFLTPFASIPKYFHGRKCLLYRIKKKITDIIDLTDTIVTNNPIFKSNQLMHKHKNEQKWLFDDFLKIMNYYNDDNVPQVHNINNKCITKDDINIQQFIKKRPYCDINNKLYYVGRRKLQEILFKTRKYDSSKIWIYDYHLNIYEKYGIKYNCADLYTNLYHCPYKIKTKLACPNYDTIILRDLGINGFFFTDYDVGYRSGGELMLTTPNNFIEFTKYSSDLCNSKDNKFKNIT